MVSVWHSQTKTKPLSIAHRLVVIHALSPLHGGNKCKGDGHHHDQKKWTVDEGIQIKHNVKGENDNKKHTEQINKNGGNINARFRLSNASIAPKVHANGWWCCVNCVKDNMNSI